MEKGSLYTIGNVNYLTTIEISMEVLQNLRTELP
jgi:hypothetical protein